MFEMKYLRKTNSRLSTGDIWFRSVGHLAANNTSHLIKNFENCDTLLNGERLIIDIIVIT